MDDLADVVESTDVPGQAQDSLGASRHRRAQALARERLDNAELGLSALEVRAPHDGPLIWTRNWRGEILKVGSMLGYQVLSDVFDESALEGEQGK